MIALYRPSTLPVTTFLNHLRHSLSTIPTSCPTTLLGDFNINMLNQNLSDVKELQHFMKFYNMYLQFQESTTIYDSQIDHVWTNAPTQQCISRVLEAHWTYHKPIYFAFKLPNYCSTISSCLIFFGSNIKAETTRLAACLCWWCTWRLFQSPTMWVVLGFSMIVLKHFLMILTGPSIFKALNRSKSRGNPPQIYKYYLDFS